MESEKKIITADLPNLTEDLLIHEILARLPVKSLLRFKCVCKKWYALIESPSFIRIHFNNPKNHTLLLVRRYIRGNIVPDYDPDLEQDNPLALAIFPDETLSGFPPVHEDIIDFIQHCPGLHQIHIIGPVDGLFLLHTGFNSCNDRLALWNPARAEFRRLPRPKFRFPKYYSRCHVFGFGFDPLTKDYKVVWIPTFFRDAPSDHAATSLYTLGTESWKQIDNPSVLASIPDIWWRCSKSKDFIDCIEYFSGAYLNGAFYWLVHCSCGQQLVLFDMCRDVFRKIPAPYNVEAPYQVHNLLVQNEDSIALLENEYRSPRSAILKFVHVWVMRQEGCWTKHFTLVCERIRYPLGFWRNSKELFVEFASNELVLCDLNTHRIKYLGVRGRDLEKSSFLRVMKYKESLVSVKAEQMENWNRDKLRDIIRDFFDLSSADDVTEEEEAEVEERAMDD